MSYEAERAAAIEAVEKASRLCRAVQGNLVDEASMDKKDKSPVTVADFGAQAVVTHVLRGVFPDLPLVGEEDAAELREADNAGLTEKVVANVNEILPGLASDVVLDLIDYGTYEGGPSGRHWTLDPIDGTKGFLRLDQYAVALALIEDGEVVLGVLGCPNLPLDAADPDGAKGCLFVAVKGEGAFARPLDTRNEERIEVTGGITAAPFRIDSQCKYGAVSRGDASIYLRLPTRKDYEEKIWDHAAGCIVIREAGGRVTDVRGKDLDFSIGRTLRDNTGVIVTNGHLHDRVIEAVRLVLGE